MAIIKRFNPTTSQWEKVNVAKEGPGLIRGGSPYQALAKESSDNYELSWQNPSLVGTSSTMLNPLGVRYTGAGIDFNGQIVNWVTIPVRRGNPNIVSVTARMNVRTLTALRNLINRGGGASYWLYLCWFNAAAGPRWEFTAANGTTYTMPHSAPPISSTAGMRWYRFTLDSTPPNTTAIFEDADDSPTEPTSWNFLSANTLTGTGGGIRLNQSVQAPYIGTWTGTNHPLDALLVRLIERWDGQEILNIDFSTAPADNLGPIIESANRYELTLQTTRYSYGIPGIQWRTQSTMSIAANTQWYFPFTISDKCSVDALVFAITANPGLAANARCAIYRADTNLQPTGAPLVDSGDIVTSIVASRYAVQIAPLVLEPGNYVTSMITSRTMTFRIANGGYANVNFPNLTTSPYYLGMNVARTYGSYPNPATQWTGIGVTSLGPAHPILFRYTPVD